MNISKANLLGIESIHDFGHANLTFETDALAEQWIRGIPLADITKLGYIDHYDLMSNSKKIQLKPITYIYETKRNHRIESNDYDMNHKDLVFTSYQKAFNWLHFHYGEELDITDALECGTISIIPLTTI